MSRRRIFRPTAACAATFVAGCALFACADSVSGQVAPEAPSQEATLPPITISPRGAFLRALALPGWGHAAIGSHTRGAFYFGTEGLTVYSLVRARRRLADVRARLTLRESVVLSRLEAEGVTDPIEIEEALLSDVDLSALRALEDSRGEQQEDLVAFGLFLLFLSGADAYVSAHLSRFPEPLEVEGTPLPDGGFEVGLRLTVH